MVERLRARGIVPTLVIVRLGERADDLSYERGAEKRCAAVGIELRHVALPESTSQDALLQVMEELAQDSAVHGILLLRPLPKGLDEDAVRRVIPAGKDVDGITDASMAGVFTGSGEGFVPCTAQAAMEILDFYSVDCAGKRAAVIGRSLVIGRPVAMLLTAKNATVTLCHSKTQELAKVTAQAEIVIAACGKTESLGAEYFAAGQTVVDVGIGWSEKKQKLCGDVRTEEAVEVVSAITPVPGGVGAVTTAILVRHVAEAAERLDP
jgi:methylenetetrahydrofolate dehydrogenase (NADP+)/methenyltetrahydrofolate cyclohydrolase